MTRPQLRLAVRCYTAVVRDATLLERWRAGDREAGDALLTRHVRSVTRFFRSKLGDDVEDLVQRTFLDLLEASDGYDADRPLEPFLFAIARRRLYDALRERHRANAFDPTYSSIAALDATPSQVAARSQEARLLQQALRHVCVEHQIVLELFYWEAMRGAEIAQVLDVSPHTVRSRLARAKAALREQIDRLEANPALRESTLRFLEREPPAD